MYVFNSIYYPQLFKRSDLKCQNTFLQVCPHSASKRDHPHYGEIVLKGIEYKKETFSLHTITFAIEIFLLLSLQL